MELRSRLEAYEQQTHAELSRLAEVHVAKYSRMLELLPADPDVYPAQRLTTFELKGNPQSSRVIAELARTAEPRFDVFKECLEEAESSRGEVSRLAEYLKTGQNVLLVTNHGDLADIGIVLAAFYGALRKVDYRPHTGIIISKMVAFLGYQFGGNTIPATDALKMACHDIYLSFPRTSSIANSRIPGVAIDLYNKALRLSIDRKLHKGGRLLAMAASGTTDKPLTDDPSTISLAGLSQGTIKLMTGGHRLVQPVAVWLQDEAPVFELCDIPRRVSNEAQAHTMMHGITDQLNKHVANKSFFYRGSPLGGVALRSRQN